MTGDEQPPVEIPYQTLTRETLFEVIREFVLREGTDYGSCEISLQTKTDQILAQLESGKVKLFFDPVTESVNLTPNERNSDVR